jgi:hypothetical protein
MKDPTQDILDAIAAYRKQAGELISPAFDIVLNNKLYQPPVDFENTYGLDGISQPYLLPEGLTSADLQTYALLIRQTEITAVQRLGKMTAVWGILAAYNPELEKLSYQPQDAGMLYHMVMGVASAFNVSDIQHFISSPSKVKARVMENSPEFIKLTDVFNRYAASGQPNFKWVAAPATLQLIQDKIISKHRCDF